MSKTIGPYELNSIVTGDARELAKAIPDESIDLIFTDPVYDRIEDYEWLAETAARVLKPDRACLVWFGIGYLPATVAALSHSSLCYRWRFVIRTVGGLQLHGRLMVGSQECLWYEKGRSRLLRNQYDLEMSTKRGRYDVNGSNWGKSPQIIQKLIGAFADSGAIIFDPFSGLGSVPVVCKTLRRDYLAFEIDPNTAAQARERVRNTQAPLPLPIPEQGALL